MPAHPHRARLVALGLALPLALAALAYGRVLDGEPLLDDQRTVERNPAVRDVGRAARALLVGVVRGGGRPVTDLSFALDRALLGPGRRGAHATSIGLHLLVAGLVFLFTRRVLALAGGAHTEAVAVAVAGLFALHPMQTEAVSYLSQRAEVLASGLSLGALLLLLAAARRGSGWGGALAWLGATAAFGLALAAKPTAMTLPAAAALLVAMIPSPAARAGLPGWRRLAALLAPLLALAAVHAAATLAGMAGAADGGFSVPGLPPGTYLLTEARVVTTYLRLLAWPAGQCADWDVPVSRSLADPAVLGAAALLAAVVAGAVALARHGARRNGADAAAARVAGFGLLWFLLLLAPTSSAVPLADVLAEHRVYLASWGLFVAAAVGTERLLAHLWPRHGPVAAAGLVAAAWVALGAATHHRNAVWETRLAFWADAAAKSPGKARVHLGLGQALAAGGDLDGARREYGLARARVGQNRVQEGLILRNLAVVETRAGRLEAAAVAYVEALQRHPGDPDTLSGLALVRARMGSAEEAAALASRALALEPEHPPALDVLAGLALERGDQAAAAALFERAARADPDGGVHLLGLGLARLGQGRRPEACEAFRAALRLQLDPGQRTAAERAATGCR